MKKGQKVKSFRLPRKTKKALKGHMWLYPSDGEGNSIMASPRRSQEDYKALKKGVLRDLTDTRESRSERKEKWNKLNQEVIIPDKELKEYLDELLRKEFRNLAYKTLIEAKNHPKAKKAYYNFINTYHIYKNGDESYGNICCMIIGNAENLLRPNRIKRMKKSRKYKKLQNKLLPGKARIRMGFMRIR